MFEKVDKPLSILRTLNNVLAWIGIIGGALSGIVLCCMDSPLFLTIGLCLLFCLPICSAISWLLVRVILNYLCDIKLIRNKLYNVGNDSLEAFLSSSKSAFRETDTYNATDSRSATEQLYTLKKLLDSGVITQEEFDVEKAKILKNM